MGDERNAKSNLIRLDDDKSHWDSQMVKSLVRDSFKRLGEDPSWDHWADKQQKTPQHDATKWAMVAFIPKYLEFVASKLNNWYIGEIAFAGFALTLGSKVFVKKA